VNACRWSIGFATKCRHLLLEHRKQLIADYASKLFLENPVKILNTSLRRCLCACLLVHGVSWFEFNFKQAMSEHRPINQHQ